MRPIEELVDVEHPAWPALAAELAAATVPVEVLPADSARGRECLYRIQVTARSRLGALALNSGGLLVDHGWLRVLGAGHVDRGLASLAEINEFDGHDQAPPASVAVGHDAVGGRFEINGPDPEMLNRPGAPGEICYLGPQFLDWVALDTTHGDWLSWIAEGFTSEFYQAVRWPGWIEEVQALPLSSGISVYPFLWSAEAQRELAATTRETVDLFDLFDRHDEMIAAVGLSEA